MSAYSSIRRSTLKGLVLYNLACLHALHGEPEEARATLDRALGLHPTAPPGRMGAHRP